MEIFLFRHGAVENPDNILYGLSNNFTLSVLGTKQVTESGLKLRSYIGSEAEVEIISSPLRRAVDTASILADIFNLKENSITTDVRLIESYNYLEGTNMAGGKNIIKNPKYWKYLYNPFKPSWGEPYVEIQARIKSIVEERKNITSTSILVSHELPIFITKRVFSGKSLFHNPKFRNIPLSSFHKIF